jgi:hypothetical protein
MRDDQHGRYGTKWDPPLTPYGPWATDTYTSWAPRPLAPEIIAVLILTPLTPFLVTLLAGIVIGHAVESGHFKLWGFIKFIAFTSAIAVFAGIRESFLGSPVIVSLGGVLARFRIDSLWVSLILGAVVGLTVPDAPSVLLDIADGQSWQEAITHRTWRGFWPFFGIVASMMSLLNWRMTIRPRRLERLAQEREAA